MRATTHTFGLSITIATVADVFAVQTEIAQQIADQLKANLSPAEKAAIAERPTADPVAYAYYTKAKEIDDLQQLGGRGKKSANQKVELLEKATQRDPNFALAYCALAKTQFDRGPDDPKHFELAKKAAEAALRVRPDLGGGSSRTGSLLLLRSTLHGPVMVTTGHVTSWRSLAASCRTILRRF